MPTLFQVGRSIARFANIRLRIRRKLNSHFRTHVRDSVAAENILQTHPRIERCVVKEKYYAYPGRRGTWSKALSITVLPRTPNIVPTMSWDSGSAFCKPCLPMDLSKQDLTQYLQEHGFAKLRMNVRIASVSDHLPLANRKYVVLSEMVKVLFDEAVRDGCKRVTLDDFADFLTRHSVVFSSAYDPYNYINVFEEHANQDNETLSKLEFQDMLFSSGMLALQDNTGNGVKSEVGINLAFHKMLLEAFFRKADTDQDGILSYKELEKFFITYGFVKSSEEARKKTRAFVIGVNSESKKGVDKHDFAKLLRRVGVLAEVGDCTFPWMQERIQKLFLKQEDTQWQQTATSSQQS